MQISIAALIPKRPLFDRAALAQAIERELDQQTQKALKEFEKSTSTWTHKPNFTVTKRTGEREDGTSDENYNRVSQGTRPHIIRPVSAKRLSFVGGYVPKTMPGSISSKSGGASGSRVFAKEVRHPGTKPRNFDKLVKEAVEKGLVTGLQQAISKAVK